MKLTGIFAADFDFTMAEVHFGQKDGQDYAQISFVIGLDWDPATGQRNDETNPYWEDNFKPCMLVIEKLEKKVPGICRQIDLRRNPYNQNYA